jgi:hypothetical protein
MRVFAIRMIICTSVEEDMYEASKDETFFFVLKVPGPPKLRHFRCLVNLLGSPLSLIREQLETFFTVLGLYIAMI